jgi:putative DNA primase/helicase
MDPAPEVAGIVEADMQDGLSRLRFWRGGWWRWSNGAYREIEPEEIRAKLLLSLNRRYHHIGTFHVANCLDQMRAQTLLAGTTEAPMWLGDASVAWPPDEILAARNGLAHLPSIASGSGEIIAPTPRFFTTTALVYDLKLNAPEPANWLEFLGALWPDGQESIDTLQEWFGYVLTQDTRLQKILLLIGPRRSGKGTIGRILTAMIGRENVAGPTLGSLATQFGLAPLLGKSLAIIADARLSGRADQAAIVEQLLSISGEDTKTIDRKHAAAVTCRLPTRLTLLSNELPRFNDASGAAAGRMILLRLEESWYGKEDHDLEQRLLTELPGILLWAVAGWARLRRRGRFAEPEASTDLREALDELTSPVFAFVQARCVVGPEHEVDTKVLYGAYRGWCEMVGRERVEDEEGFGRALRAAITVERKQRKEGGHRWRVYMGVGLLPAPCG